MCRSCRKPVPARVLEEHGVVYQERLCPACGSSRARIADGLAWYLDRMRTGVICKPARLEGTPVHAGCPFDCGPCRAHVNACRLPVFSVTNACNMECPVCFTYNREDKKYFMSRKELRSLLDKLIARAGPFDLLNITGGEPTLHPELLELVKECQRPEIGRVTMNSNGLRLAEDEKLCSDLATLGVYVVLSFDTLRSATALQVHGRDVVALKLRALENLQRFGIGVTLLNVMIRGVNEQEIGDIVNLARSHPVVRSLTVQTMTFTGKGGKNFSPREHMPLDGAAAALHAATRGEMREEHFAAHPGAHPLCYSVAHYLRTKDKFHSFTEVFTRAELRSLFGHGYLLQPQAESEQVFRAAIDRLWASGDPANLLPVLKRLVERMYPAGKHFSQAQRQRVVEESILAVYLHAHMDEDTLDLGRLAACPDQVPDPEGRLVPACAYNLFYRQKDPRFWYEPNGHNSAR